jgi:hypothetical protein
MGKRKTEALTGPCLFCGGPTDGRHPEHVIPRWMQKRFNLFNEPLVLPNRTTLRMSQAQVPACERHNKIFGRIEERLAQGAASPMEIFLWGLKVRAGLWYLDSRLRHDQSDADSGPVQTLLTDDLGALQERREWVLRQFRDTARMWHSGGTFSPMPPGSVFDLPSRSPGFIFVHHPFGCVAVNVPPRFYAVFAYDGGAAQKNGGYAELWTRRNAKVPALLNYEMTDFELPPAPEAFERLWLAVVLWGCTHQDGPVSPAYDDASQCLRLTVPAWKTPPRLLFPDFTNLAHGCNVHCAVEHSHVRVSMDRNVLREVQERSIRLERAARHHREQQTGSAR